MSKDLINQLEELKQNTFGLKNTVVEYILDHNSTDEEVEQFFNELFEHGCQSGMVTTLIYYYDTVKFYEEHREDISNLLYEMFEQTGLYSPKDLFGNKWDDEDPLAINEMNQNLLTWFGFEETARNIANEIGLEY